MGDILESSRVASLPFCQESSNLVALSAFLHEKNKGSNRLHHCCNYRIIKLKFLNIKKMEKRNKRKREKIEDRKFSLSTKTVLMR